jgi:hypothetical protein
VNPLFCGYQQHDSHEAVITILDALYETTTLFFYNLRENPEECPRSSDFSNDRIISNPQVAYTGVSDKTINERLESQEDMEKRKQIESEWPYIYYSSTPLDNLKKILIKKFGSEVEKCFVLCRSISDGWMMYKRRYRGMGEKEKQKNK